jgi:hypothetical protein
MDRNHIAFKFLRRFAGALLAFLLLVMSLAVALTPGHAQGPEELVFVYKEGPESAAMLAAISYTDPDPLPPGTIAIEVSHGNCPSKPIICSFLIRVTLLRHFYAHRRNAISTVRSSITTTIVKRDCRSSATTSKGITA